MRYVTVVESKIKAILIATQKLIGGASSNGESRKLWAANDLGQIQIEMRATVVAGARGTLQIRAESIAIREAKISASAC